MPRSPSPLPDALGEIFTAAEARLAGVDPRRLRQPDAVRLRRGVHARARAVAISEASEIPDGDALHPHERWRRTQVARACALAPLLGAERFFSHRTAAALWGMPIAPATGSADSLDVASHRETRGRSSAGVHGRILSPRLAGVTSLRSVPLTDPATTWALLAPELPRDDAVALGDAAIHLPRISGTDRLRRDPLAALDDLQRAAHAPYRRGGDRLRAILLLLSPHASSPPETHLRLRLAEWGAPEPSLDHDVRDARGRCIGTSEVAFTEYRLALEYEGIHHFTSTQQYDRDIEKYQRYAENGWEVLRVTAQLLYRDRRELRRRLFEALARRGWRP